MKGAAGRTLPGAMRGTCPLTTKAAGVAVPPRTGFVVGRVHRVTGVLFLRCDAGANLPLETATGVTLLADEDWCAGPGMLMPIVHTMCLEVSEDFAFVPGHLLPPVVVAPGPAPGCPALEG